MIVYLSCFVLSSPILLCLSHCPCHRHCYCRCLCLMPVRVPGDGRKKAWISWRLCSLSRFGLVVVSDVCLCHCSCRCLCRCLHRCLCLCFCLCLRICLRICLCVFVFILSLVRFQQQKCRLCLTHILPPH